MRADQYAAPENEILEKRLIAADKPGQHLWIITAGWIMTDPASAYDPAVIKLLDRENLVALAGPGCYKCEKPYSGKMAKRPCLGSLELQP
jgi:hypothetical protein